MADNKNNLLENKCDNESKVNNTSYGNNSSDHSNGSNGSYGGNDTRHGLDIIQCMIDISADRLEGLRTQCVTSAELTQQEIRTLETKLVKMFSQLLITKSKIPDRLPKGLPSTSAELKQWLRIVGLSAESLNLVIQGVNTLELLLDKNDNELKLILSNNNINTRDEDIRRLLKAMINLKKCYEAIQIGDREPKELYWDSWDRHNNHQLQNNQNQNNKATGSSPRANRTTRRIRLQQNRNNESTNSPNDISSPDSISQTNDKYQKPTEDYMTVRYVSSGITPSPSPPNSPLPTYNLQNVKQKTLFSQFVSNNYDVGSIGYCSDILKTPLSKRKPQTLLDFQLQLKQDDNLCCGGVKAKPTKSSQQQIVKHSVHFPTATTIPPPSSPSSPISPVLYPMSSISLSMTSATNTTIKKSYKSAISLINQNSNNNNYSNDKDNQNIINNNSNIEVTLPNVLKQHTHPSSPKPIHKYQSLTIRTRLHTDPIPENVTDIDNPQVPPRSPCTPLGTRGMGHSIAHRFTKKFKVMSTCDLCNKQMFFGYKCKECKYRCHRDCVTNVPPSCGLPPEFYHEFKNSLQSDVFLVNSNNLNYNTNNINNSSNISNHNYNTSPNIRLRQQPITTITTLTTTTITTTGPINRYPQNHQQLQQCGGGASIICTNADSSGSSCNSSSPSSPALIYTATCQQHQQQHSHHHQQSLPQTPAHSLKQNTQFTFPDVTQITSQNKSESNGTNLNNCVVDGGIGGMNGNCTLTSQSLSNNNSSKLINCTTTTIFTSITTITTMSNAISSFETKSCTILSETNKTAPSMISPSVTRNTATILIKPKETLQQITINDKKIIANANNSILSTAIPLDSVTEEYDLVDSNDGNVSNNDNCSGGDGTVGIGSSSGGSGSGVDGAECDANGEIIWPRQNSISLKEWDIPFDDIQLLETIGKGRFGIVYRASWHGDCAIKILHKQHGDGSEGTGGCDDDESKLEAFKYEVAAFKKTRHANLILFMGACMKPQAIVTALCKGNTLHTHIHDRHDKFNLIRMAVVAQQIAQGMGYLHSRDIIHKDLTTKNIFLDNGKVVITDFGLFSSTKLYYSIDLGLSIPRNWICYLAPELVRSLKSYRNDNDYDEFPLTKSSDIYAFGTVWYQLLCGEFPFKSQPSEAVIFQIGFGIKQSLANVQSTRDVKDILMLCWSYQADDRPDFQRLTILLDRLPKKRLARSPSHPVQLSRSAESVF